MSNGRTRGTLDMRNMKRLLQASVLAWIAGGSLVSAAITAPAIENEMPGADPLVPFDAYQETVSFSDPQISPDGKHFVFLGPVANVPNLMMAATDNPGEAKALTHDAGRGFQGRTIWGERSIRWAEDSRHLLYMRDDKGDENWVLYSLDTVTGKSLRLTPASGVRVKDLQTSTSHPDEVLFSMNDHDPKARDYYTANIITGALQHVVGMAPYQAKFFDRDFKERIGLTVEPDQSWTIDRRDAAGKWGTLTQLTSEDAAMMMSNQINDLGGSVFSADNSKLIAFSSKDLDTEALVEYDMKSGQRSILAVEKGVDVKRALVNPATGAPQAYVRYWTEREWRLLDPTLRGDFDYLKRLDEGQIDVESRSRDDGKWIVSFMHADFPIRYFLYDRARRASVLLGVSSPQLAKLKLSKLQPFVTKSSDGFDLVSYIAYPTWVKLNAEGIPDKPLPMITLVHGGPSDERPELVFAPIIQWLTNRGYVFFYVDFRGSTGFGKAFMNAQRREWGGAMNRDVVEQVQAVVKRGIADPKRVGIFGGSYGGYETLVAMTKTPGVFACGAELAGPSNLETFTDPATMPPDWNAAQWYDLLGDPRTKEGLALLRDRSPTNFADQTRGSVLIAQGANDVRVPTREATAIADRMKEHGVEVTYLLYPDEGHGLQRKENHASFYSIVEVFFGRCLGGRYASLTTQMENSSIQAPLGAEYIPGLQKALAARVSDGMTKADTPR
jgi:dipeptidyl aminopeptidase/acylaminoacyl peptidase